MFKFGLHETLGVPKMASSSLLKPKSKTNHVSEASTDFGSDNK